MWKKPTALHRTAVEKSAEVAAVSAEVLATSAEGQRKMKEKLRKAQN